VLQQVKHGALVYAYMAIAPQASSHSAQHTHASAHASGRAQHTRRDAAAGPRERGRSAAACTEGGCIIQRQQPHLLAPFTACWGAALAGLVVW
jgi:hypothetical protein